MGWKLGEGWRFCCRDWSAVGWCFGVLRAQLDVCFIYKEWWRQAAAWLLWMCNRLFHSCKSLVVIV